MDLYDTSVGKALMVGVEMGNKIGNLQQKFVESNLYDIFNTALDTGIRIALPDIAEDAVIDIKDNLFEYGIKDGIKEVWNDVKDYGKSALGIATGNFESIEQVQKASKSGRSNRYNI